jgi:hypothetical protein
MTLQAVDIGRICQDCAFIVANGEDSCEDPCEHGKGLPVSVVLTGDTEDNESEFYVPWRPCPGCGTTLAGSWFEAAELVPADSDDARAAVPVTAVWADGFGRWHARVSRHAAGPLLGARRLIRDAMAERQAPGTLARHYWSCLIERTELSTAETIVYTEPDATADQCPRCQDV